MSSKPVDAPETPNPPASKAERKALASLIAQWQPPLTDPEADKKKNKGLNLADLDPAAKPFSVQTGCFSERITRFHRKTARSI